MRTPAAPPARVDSRPITIAATGNPNAGKTALFNAMTGVRQKTGNWPGVTVDRREGRYTFEGRRCSLIDLPGTYSLDPTSPDQRIARDFVLGGEVDVVLDVVDASNLERHLYLAIQLAELRVPMVVALNMVDVALRAGAVVDAMALSRELGCEVVPVVAIKGDGIEELRAAIERAASSGRPPSVDVDYGDTIAEKVATIIDMLGGGATADERGPDRTWLAHRLLEGDDDALLPVDATTAEFARASSADVAETLGDDTDFVMANCRYSLAHEIVGRVVVRPNLTVGHLSDRVDRVLIHRIWGVPIFLGVMYLMFMFTINIGGAFIDVFDGIAGALFVDGVRQVLAQFGAPVWMVVVLADGFGGGIQVVATFVPVLAALFLFMSVLEDSGYMARAAFVVDRMMRRIGLPGKAFVPMIVGFGCNVPAVMATRTLEDERERKLTILMNPFMSCGARLPVYALFAAAFFPTTGQNVVFLLYMIGVAAALATGLVMKHSLLPGRSEGFLMELPSYHRPTARDTALRTWDRLSVFVRKAGVVIVVMVMALAVLNSVGTDGSFGNEDSERSVLAEIGRTITPVFTPIGIDEDNWPATVGIFTGVLAKEAVVGTLDSLYGSLAVAGADAGGEDEEDVFRFWAAIGDSVATVPRNLSAVARTYTDPLGLSVGDVGTIEVAAEEQEVDAGVYGAMQERFDGRAGAFAYLMFILLYLPCVAVIGAIVREAGRRWALFVAVWTTSLAFVAATSFYQLATIADHPLSSIAWLATLAVAVTIAFVVLRRRAVQNPATPIMPVTVPPRTATGQIWLSCCVNPDPPNDRDRPPSRRG